MGEQNTVQNIKDLEKKAIIAEKRALKNKDKQACLVSAKTWETLIDYYSENNLRSKMALAYHHSAHMYFLNGQFLEKAGALYSAGALNYALLDKNDHSLEMWKKSATIYVKLKKYEQAAEIYLTIAQLYGDDSDKLSMAEYYALSGKTYGIGSNELQSARYHKKAGEIYEELCQWELANQNYLIASQAFKSAERSDDADQMATLSAAIIKSSKEKSESAPMITSQPKAEEREVPQEKSDPSINFVPAFSFLKRTFPTILVIVLSISLTVIYFLTENYKKPSPIEYARQKQQEAIAPQISDSQGLEKKELNESLIEKELQLPNDGKPVKIVDLEPPIKVDKKSVENKPPKSTDKQLKKAQKTTPKITKKENFVPIKSQKERYYEQAISDYEEIIKQNPKDDMAYMELGALYRNRNDYRKALKNLEFAVNLNPKNSQAYYYLGYVYKEMNQIDPAIKSFKKYLELNPNIEEIHFQLGNLYSLKNRTTSAIIEFESAIRLNTQHFEAYQRLGSLYESQEMYEQSIDNYSMAVQLNPTDLQTHMALSWLYNKVGKITEAQRENEIVKKLKNQ